MNWATTFWYTEDKMFDQARLEKQILSLSPQGKLSCKLALELADKNQISRAQLGQILNELKIKVVNCQLGCF